MNFSTRIREMVAAVERGEAGAVAACFTADGVYHDVFYGDFAGRDAIVDMIENYFYRDASQFRWDIHDPVEAGGSGYARYVFSYLPTGVAQAQAQVQVQVQVQAKGRTLFEGVAICRMQDGLIADYREVANAAVGLHGMGFAPERLVKFIAREAGELRQRTEAARHIS